MADMIDVARSEEIEVEIDAFIERRSRDPRQEEEQRRIEEAWRESEERDLRRRRRLNRALWFSFYSRLARALRERAEYYERRAEALCTEHEEGGKE